MTKEKEVKVFRRSGKEILIEVKYKNEWHREVGFRERGAREQIDKDLPICPFCKADPVWELRDARVSIKGGPLAKLKGRKVFGGSHWEGRWKESRRYFRCQECHTVISQSAEASLDVNENFRIERVEENQNLQHLIDEEYPIEVLQEWMRARPRNDQVAH